MPKKSFRANFLDIQNLNAQEIVHRAYPKIFFDKIFLKMKLEDKNEAQIFIDRILRSGEVYINLKYRNQNRISPFKQNKILNEYRDALNMARAKYIQIQSSVPASGKLAKAVRKKYASLDLGMKEMFKPYCDSNSMAISLFENFLGVLAETAEEAKFQDIGLDKADILPNIFKGWIAEIGRVWPKNSSVAFALGKYDSVSAIYTSSCIPILREIVCRLEPKVSEKEIVTALRAVKKQSKNSGLQLLF